MKEKENLIFGGYYFGSAHDAAKAEKEAQKAQYLNERISSMSTNQMVAVYNKMLDEKVFSTPVGWEYLKFLKGQIIQAGVPEEELRPIPLFVTFTTNKEDNEYAHIAKMHINEKKTQAAKTKEQLRTSVFINIFLVILVIVMFLITINGSHPNIINYKKAITDNYSAWEQELTEIEAALRERENALENSDG